MSLSSLEHSFTPDTLIAGVDAMSEYSRDAHGRYTIRCWASVPEYKNPHRFKKTEWYCTKRELVAALTSFYQEFGLDDWWPNDVDHFLSCLFHLIKGPKMLHHARCVVTLIRQGVVARSVHRLGRAA